MPGFETLILSRDRHGRGSVYSPRKVSAGSTDAARRAGTIVAANANTLSATADPPRIAGLYQLIPYR